MERIPITILAGSDRKASRLPAQGRGLHPLAAYKGAAIQVSGRPLVAHLTERIAATEGFGPVTVAGPARIFEALAQKYRLDYAVVDTDSTVATNLRAALRAHGRAAAQPMAILACDVLPTPTELDAQRALYEELARPAVFFPLVRAPHEPVLGAFGWKPTYALAPETGAVPTPVLPGHLGILTPGALRLPLLFSLLDAAYRTRNRSVAYRRTTMALRVLGTLLGRDLTLLATLRAPTRTWTVLSRGMRLAAHLRDQTLDLPELQRLIADLFVRTAHRREHPGDAVRCPFVDTLSLAQDIDTMEEAVQVGGITVDAPLARSKGE